MKNFRFVFIHKNNNTVMDVIEENSLGEALKEFESFWNDDIEEIISITRI